MTLTPEQIAQGWRLHDGSNVCPIKDDKTVLEFMQSRLVSIGPSSKASSYVWSAIIAYRIIEAHGADAEPARPTPFPQSYADLVFTDDGWSQTIIVDGKRPEWLRVDDAFDDALDDRKEPYIGRWFDGSELAIRVRRRETKRETVRGTLSCQGNFWPVSYDLLDGKPDLSTLKIAEDAL